MEPGLRSFPGERIGYPALEKGEATHSSILGLPLVVQTVKNLPAMQEILVQSLGWEDPLEKGTATHTSILAWRIPLDRGAWRSIVYAVAESDRTERLSIVHVLTES